MVTGPENAETIAALAADVRHSGTSARKRGGIAAHPSPGSRFAPATLSPEGRGEAGADNTAGEVGKTGAAGATSPLRGEVDAQRRVRGSVSRARSLRSNETEAEHKLWGMLRGRQLGGYKFIRQSPVGPYVADFACREAALIIELDGSQHAESERDEIRTRYLNDQGYSVLRLWNDDVRDLRGVADAILAAISLHPSPGERFAPATLSPEGRGERGVRAATTRQRSYHLTADIPRLSKD